VCLRVLLRGADAGDADVVRLMGKTMEEVVWYGRIEVVFVCELEGGRVQMQVEVESGGKLAATLPAREDA
jgi:hypothetical protein